MDNEERSGHPSLPNQQFLEIALTNLDQEILFMEKFIEATNLAKMDIEKMVEAFAQMTRSLKKLQVTHEKFLKIIQEESFE